MTSKEHTEVLDKLYGIVDDLDAIQETDIAQQDENFVWAVGEAIGSIYNAIDCIELKGGE